MYTAPLGDICRSHGIACMCYADDTQLYLSFKLSQKLDMSECVSKLENCVRDIKLWMRTNLLKLNDEKTECILFGTQFQLSKIEDFSTTVRNLGYFMDSQMKRKEHISRICRSTYLTLKNLNRIRTTLTRETRVILVQGLITSRLDYCNSLLLGTYDCYLSKLQRFQNMACRTIYGLRKYDRVSPAIQELHWLKIRERISYKVLVFVYQCVNKTAPSYVQSLLEYRHGRSLRSAHNNNLPIAKCNLEQVRQSSFKYAAPRLWNELPLFIKQSH